METSSLSEKSGSGSGSGLKELDGWIQQLMECKQLPENHVKTLCEKVTDQFNVAHFNLENCFHFRTAHRFPENEKQCQEFYFLFHALVYWRFFPRMRDLDPEILNVILMCIFY